jgi:hypothetical protein
MSDSEPQSDQFLANFQRNWSEFRQKSSEGMTIGKQAEKSVFSVTNPDVLRACDDFFAALAIFMPLFDQIELWQNSLNATSSSVTASAETWRSLFSKDPRFSEAVPAFLVGVHFHDSHPAIPNGIPPSNKGGIRSN